MTLYFYAQDMRRLKLRIERKSRAGASQQELSVLNKQLALLANSLTYKAAFSKVSDVISRFNPTPNPTLAVSS